MIGTKTHKLLTHCLLCAANKLTDTKLSKKGNYLLWPGFQNFNGEIYMLSSSDRIYQFVEYSAAFDGEHWLVIHIGNQINYRPFIITTQFRCDVTQIVNFDASDYRYNRVRSVRVHRVNKVSMSLNAKPIYTAKPASWLIRPTKHRPRCVRYGEMSAVGRIIAQIEPKIGANCFIVLIYWYNFIDVSYIGTITHFSSPYYGYNVKWWYSIICVLQWAITKQ